MRKVAIFLIISRLTNGQNAITTINSIKMSFQLLKNSLRKLESRTIYIYIASFHFQNRDFCVKDTDGQNTRGGKKMPPACISLRPSKELDSHGKKLVKQLVSRKVNIWKETERH